MPPRIHFAVQSNYQLLIGSDQIIRIPPSRDGTQWEGLYRFTSFAVEHEVLAPYAYVVREVVLPNFRAFGWGVLIVEGRIAAGASLRLEVC
jgi:hypothetical protein